MHAAWWNSPRLEHLSWLKSWRDPKEAALIEELYQRSWSEVEKVGFEIPAAVRGIGSRFGPHSAEIHRQLSQPPWTLVHGDVHLDNVMFGETDNAPAVTILDWQIVGQAAQRVRRCDPPGLLARARRPPRRGAINPSELSRHSGQPRRVGA